MILLAAALQQAPLPVVAAGLFLCQLFLLWAFGHDIDWELDILLAMAGTLLSFLLPLLVGVEKADSVVAECLIVAHLVSIAYLLDWQTWWQQWPLPTVSAVILLVAFRTVFPSQ